MFGRFSPRLWSVALTVFVTLWIVEDISRQVSSQPSTICLAPLIFLLLLGDYVYRLIRGATVTSMPGGNDSPFRGAWRWGVLPLALAVLVSCLVYPWPMDLRFSLSQEAFERKAEEVLQNRADQGPQRVGLYWVDRVFVESEAYVGFQTGSSIADPVGFANDPTRPRSHPFNRHIIGNWYATEW